MSRAQVISNSLINLFPRGICKIIAEYGIYLEYLYCPLSGQLFKDPVYINHPGIKPLVYEKDDVIVAAASGELLQFSNVIDWIAVPFVHQIIKALRTHSIIEITELKKIINFRQPQTNLEVDLIEALHNATALRHTQFHLKDFLNNYEYPISGKNTFRQFDYLSHQQKTQLHRFNMHIKGLAVFWHLFQQPSDKFLLSLGSLGDAVNSHNFLFALLDFALRVDGLNLYLELSRPGMIDFLKDNPKLFFIDKIVGPLFLRMRFLRTNLSLSSSTLTLLTLSPSLLKLLNPLSVEISKIFFYYPVLEISSQQTVAECKQIYDNPSSVLQVSRDIDGFSESSIKTFTRRFGRFSSALLMALATYTATESPLHALLAFISTFNLDSLTNVLNLSENRYILMPAVSASPNTEIKDIQKHSKKL